MAFGFTAIGAFAMLLLAFLSPASARRPEETETVCENPAEGRAMLQISRGDLVGEGSDVIVGAGAAHGSGAGEQRDAKYNATGEGSYVGAGGAYGGGGGKDSIDSILDSSTWSWKKMKAMSAQFSGHRVLLRKALMKLQASMAPANQEVDDMMSEMIDQQSTAQDHTPTELAKAHHDLAELHQNILDLGNQVNATEAQIESLTDSLNTVHDDMASAEAGLETAAAKCDSDKDSDRSMLAELRTELEAMEQLGAEGFTGRNHSLIQMKGVQEVAPQRPSTGRTLVQRHGPSVRNGKQPMSVADAKAKVEKTKKMAQSLAACVARAKGVSTAPALEQQTPRFPSPPSRTMALAGHTQNPMTECGGNTSIQIRLGGILKIITPGRTLQDGEYSTHDCSDVNSKYQIGSIWMSCKHGYVDVDLSHCRLREGPDSDQCKEEAEVLQEQYTEAYQEIALEISEFEAAVASTACVDAAQQTHQQRIDPLTKTQQQLSASLTTQTTQLGTYRSRISDAATTEESLRKEIEDLAQRDETMEDAVESLDRVRDAIHILDLCPGIGHLDFVLPTWVGTWVVLDVQNNLRDAEIDAEMYTMCRGLSSTNGGVPRPAETGEIQQAAVQNAPETNTASVPLMGTCPGCQGVADSQSGVTHPSGHARVCWDPQSTLGEAGRREDCGHGRKAIMCVLDQNQ